MKPKKLSKRFILNKSTIADLNGNALKKVKGGCLNTQCVSCPTYDSLCGGTEDICPCSVPQTFRC